MWCPDCKTDLLVAFSCNERDDAKNELPSTWVVLAREEADLANLGVRAGWPWSKFAPRPGKAVWTDDYSNVFDVFVWSQPGGDKTE